MHYAGGMNQERKSGSVGLCASCALGRRIESARGSEVPLRELSETHPAFPKRPRLRVISLPGYARRDNHASHE
jgi:hypothetical protein